MEIIFSTTAKLTAAKDLSKKKILSFACQFRIAKALLKITNVYRLVTVVISFMKKNQIRPIKFALVNAITLSTLKIKKPTYVFKNAQMVF